jgi:ABC-2 type transport system permease protein
MDWSRTAVLALVYVAWTAIWMGLTLIVSARSTSARAALITLLSLWMASTMIAPRLASEIAARAYPTPSAVEFQRALDADLSDRRPIEERLAVKRQELFARYGVESEEALPINFAGISLQQGEEHGNEVFDRHFGQLYDTFDRQNRLTQLAGFLAPTLAVRALSMGLAGSDVTQHRHFAMAAEQYRRHIQRVLNNDIAQHQKRGEVYLAKESLWSSVADFDYRAPGLGWVLAEQAPAAVALLAWVVALGLAALAAVRRVGAL